MQIAPGAYSIGDPGRLVGARSCAYLFDSDGKLTLVDTGWKADARLIVEYIRRIGRSVGDLSDIVLTHAHRSHLGGLATLRSLSGATVWSHESEADVIEGRRHAQPVSLRPLRPLSIYHLRIGALVDGVLLPNPSHGPCPVDRYLADGDRIGPLQAVHTPGHTPGHMAFYWPENQVLLVGDAVATWPSLGPGWPGFNLDEERYRMSLRRMAYEFEVDVIGPGHGDPITERAAEILRRLVERPTEAGSATEPRLSAT